MHQQMKNVEAKDSTCVIVFLRRHSVYWAKLGQSLADIRFTWVLLSRVRWLFPIAPSSFNDYLHYRKRAFKCFQDLVCFSLPWNSFFLVFLCMGCDNSILLPFRSAKIQSRILTSQICYASSPFNLAFFKNSNIFFPKWI